MPFKVRTMESHAIGPLTAKQAKYAEEFVNGKCKVNRYYHPLPQVQQAIQNIQVKAQSLASYGLYKALDDCDKAAEFAYEKGNSMAVVKAIELKSKLAGLLVEKHEIITVSLKDALDLAKSRALERTQLAQVESRTITVSPDLPASPCG